MTALTVYALLAGGLLLWPWHGTALAQQLDAAEVTNREYQEFIGLDHRVGHPTLF